MEIHKMPYIRTAGTEDAEEILEIYAHYVENTAITFEYEVPSLAEFRGRMEKTLSRYPYIVAVDEEGIAGYAYTGAFVGRAAYDWSVETTIYVKKDKKKTGLGRLLYDTLEQISKAQHVLNLNACIGVPETEDRYLDNNSMKFHLHMGYSLVGKFHQCGYKFGRWYSMVWMEKFTGEHPGHPESFIPFPQLNPADLAIRRIL